MCEHAGARGGCVCLCGPPRFVFPTLVAAPLPPLAPPPWPTPPCLSHPFQAALQALWAASAPAPRVLVAPGLMAAWLRAGCWQRVLGPTGPGMEMKWAPRVQGGKAGGTPSLVTGRPALAGLGVRGAAAQVLVAGRRPDWAACVGPCILHACPGPSGRCSLEARALLPGCRAAETRFVSGPRPECRFPENHVPQQPSTKQPLYRMGLKIGSLYGWSDGGGGGRAAR